MSGELDGHKLRGLNITKRVFMKNVWENGFGKCKTKMRDLDHLALKVKIRFKKSKLSMEESRQIVDIWFIACYGEEKWNEEK